MEATVESTNEGAYKSLTLKFDMVVHRPTWTHLFSVGLIFLITHDFYPSSTSSFQVFNSLIK